MSKKDERLAFDLPEEEYEFELDPSGPGDEMLKHNEHFWRVSKGMSLVEVAQTRTFRFLLLIAIAEYLRNSW